MFKNMMNFIKKLTKKQNNNSNSKDKAKERLHLVLMQDRANVSADFLDLMRQEIIDVIKKYIEIDESAIDVRLTNKENEDGTNGAPALYANIPIINIREEVKEKKEPAFVEEEKQEQQNITKEVSKDSNQEDNLKTKQEDNNDNENNQNAENSDKTQESEAVKEEKK